MLHASERAGLTRQKLALLCVFLLPLTTASGQEEQGRINQAKLLWNEFSAQYSEDGLAQLPAEEINRRTAQAIREEAGNRLYRDRLSEQGEVPEIVAQLAELKPADPFLLMEEAINGFMRSQSRWEFYVSSEDRELLRQLEQGNSAGAGMQLNEDSSGRFSLTPFSGSPAKKAGVLPGDELIAIEGKPVAGWSIPRIKSQVLGPPRTELLIRVRRQSGGEKDLRLQRDQHQEPVVRMKKNIAGYVMEVRVFSKGSAAVAKAELEQVPENSRLMIDLRGNAGGELQEAINFASLFLPEGAVVFRQRHQDGNTEIVRAQKGASKQLKSIVCLLDRHTASAPELVVAALLTQPGTSLQGERSYGKNRILSEYNLEHGGTMVFETSEMLDPSGRAWDKGIDPAKAAQGDSPY